MPSAWVRKRGKRYRVEYRLGGRESSIRYAGTFERKGDALDRRAWVVGEMAAMRVPDVRLVTTATVVTLATVAERWRVSRISVSDGTRATHVVNVGRIIPVLGATPPAAITKADVAGLVAKLHEDGLARESIRKTIATLAMVLDHAEVAPNPARGVELPERQHEDVNPPTALHVEAVLAAIPSAYRLPTLVLDATGLRVGELERLTWGDVDEHDGRLLIAAARTKTRRARWVDVPDVLFDHVVELVPREDRDLASQVFDGLGADRFRTSLTRACKATGTPHFHPHDLRHRRATLWHLSGVPAAQAAGWLGHSAQEHLRTYAHVMLDRTELDYSKLLDRDRVVLAPVLADSSESVD
jgi:integrase